MLSLYYCDTITNSEHSDLKINCCLFGILIYFFSNLNLIQILLTIWVKKETFFFYMFFNVNYRTLFVNLDLIMCLL